MSPTTLPAAPPAPPSATFTVELSIRLLKPGTTASTALKVDHELTERPCAVGVLYGGQTAHAAPDWVRFLAPAAQGIEAVLLAQQASAVLLVTAAQGGVDRLFAIAFGQGHHAIDPDRVERQFGMRVVLNSVARDALRALDSATLDTTVIQRRTQASRAIDLREFGIDTDRDLLRLASGRPSNAGFAKSLSGKDALHIRRSLPVENLPALCAELLSIHGLALYKQDFGFIDHIKPIEDRGERQQLDAAAFAQLGELVRGQPSDLHLAIAEPLTPDASPEVSYFGAGLPKAKQRFVDVDIDDYVAELARGDFASLQGMDDVRQSQSIRAADGGRGSVRLYNCLVCEADLGGRRCVLFDGEWYEIDARYAAGIEAAYRSVLKTSFLPRTPCMTERDLITALSTDARLLCIDQTRIAPAGAPRAQLEACDFFSLDRELIHLKDGHSAAPLSHLWNQAFVAAEALIRDRSAREGFRRAVRARERRYGRGGFLALAPLATRMDPVSYPIVFGVMRKPAKRSRSLDLSFFAKVALHATTRRLNLMGFTVQLHLIEKP